MESRVNAGAPVAGRAPSPVWATPAMTALLVVALTLPRIVFAVRYGLIGDEVYYAGSIARE